MRMWMQEWGGKIFDVVERLAFTLKRIKCKMP